MLKKLHHVAYRCKDTTETVAFYTRALGLPFTHAILGEQVPSIMAADPHPHIFFEMADGSCIAFFEVPQSPPAQKDNNTPIWVQHLALEVENEAALEEGKQWLLAHGIDVVALTDQGFCKSNYFFDPNGHRLEMTVRTERADDREKYAAEAAPLLEQWEQQKIVRNWRWTDGE